MRRCAVRVLFLLALAFLPYLFLPREISASGHTCANYNLSSNNSGCTRDRVDVLREYGAGCEDLRIFYNCPNDVRCSKDYNTCSNTSICNAPMAGGGSDGYTCDNWCGDLAVEPNCGRPPGLDCPTFRYVCRRYECRPAGGTGGGVENYTCPSPQQCTSEHQCVTQVPSVVLTVNGGGQTSVSTGQQFLLEWSSTGAAECHTSTEQESAGNQWTPLGDGRAAAGDESRSKSTGGTFKYSLTCSNTAGGTSRDVFVVVSEPPPTPAPTVDLKCNGSDGSISTSVGSIVNLSWTTTNSPTSCTASGDWLGSKSTSGGTESQTVSSERRYTYSISCSNSGGTSPTDSCEVNATTSWACSVWSTTSSKATADANGGGCNTGEYCVELGGSYNPQTGIVWPVQQNWSWGSNLTPARTFKSWSYGSGTVRVGMTAVDNSGRGTTKTCDPTPVSVPSRPGGGPTPTLPPGATPTPTPTPGPVPLGYTGLVRFFNSDGVTPYNGADQLWVLNDTRNLAARQWTGTDYKGTNHNFQFYPCTTHTGNYGYESICWSRPSHESYDPGYQINADGTISGCPSANTDACSLARTLSPDDQQSVQGCTNRGERACTLPGQDCLLASGETCTSVNEEGNWWQCQNCRVETNDVCMEDFYPDSSETRFPRCFSPWPGPPRSITRTSTQVSWSIDEYACDGIDGSGTVCGRDLTRNVERTLSVGAPAAVRLKVVKVCAADFCDWGGVQNPSGSPNRGRTVKNFNQPHLGRTNYWASPYERPSSNEGHFVYDVFVQGNTHSVSGNVLVDNLCDGRNGSDTDYNGARVALTGASGTQTRTSGEFGGPGNYSFTDLAAGGSYTVSLGVPSGYRSCPSSSSLVSIPALGSDQTVNFAITPAAGAWYQTKDADLLTPGTLTSRIPQQCTLAPACSPYLSIVGDGGYPGIPVYASGTPSYGFGSVSARGWIVNTRYTGPIFNYAYFAARQPAGATEITDGAITNAGYFNSNGTADSRGYKWFRRNGDLTVDTGLNMNVEDNKVVLFVNGNLTIGNRVSIRRGRGFFAAFASGDIIVDPNVVYQGQPAPAAASQPGLEGIFFAERNIRTGTSAPSNDRQLYIRGILAALGSIQLQRNLDAAGTGTGNNTTPAEFIEYAPDLVLNFPPELLRDGVVWEEVAP